MKKSLLLLLMTTISFLFVEGETLRVLSTRLPQSQSHLNSVAAPLRNVTSIEDSAIIKVSYTIPNIMVTPDTVLYPGTYYWSLEGCGVSVEPSTPSYPVKTEVYSLPGDASDIRLQIEDSVWHKFTSHVPTPARKSLPQDGSGYYSFENVPPISADTSLAAKMPVHISGITKYRDRTLVYVTFEPCKYYSKDKSTAVIERLTFNISFASQVFRVIEIDDPYFPENYLIVTFSKYVDALQPFKEWKEQCGCKVHVIQGDNWPTATDYFENRNLRRQSIKSAIKKVYDSDKDLLYVIFAGDRNELPGAYAKYWAASQREGTMEAYLQDANTDYYYMCMDGENDEEPDLISGRFLASSPEEMSVIVNKIVKYEKNPVTDEDFYDNVLHLAYFDDRATKTYTGEEIPPDGRENIYSVHTSEYLRESAIMNGKNVKRIYTRTPIDYPSPQFMVSAIPAERTPETPLPAELLSDSFQWYSTRSMITNEINNGKLYVLYSGHGDLNGWTNPEYKQPFDDLTNGSCLPVIFSDACSTGQFWANSLAPSLLTHNKGGAIAVFAAEQNVLAAESSQMTRAIFNGFWRRDVESDTSKNFVDPGAFGGTITLMGLHTKKSIRESEIQRITLGKCLRKSYEFLTRQANGHNTPGVMKMREMFHLFGDPGMVFHTKKPDLINDVRFKLEKPNVGMGTIPTVRLNEPALISFHGSIPSEYKRTYGTSLGCLQLFTHYPYYFVVQRYNHIPFIIKVTADGVWTSAPLVYEKSLGFLAIVRSAPGEVEISYSLATQELMSQSDAEIEVRDFNNNLVATEKCNEPQGSMKIYSNGIKQGYYVVSLHESGCEPVYSKLIIN